MDKWKEERKDGRIEGCMDGWIEGCMDGVDGWMEGWTDWRMHAWMGGRMDGWKDDGWMDGWKDDGWMDGRMMDGWMEGWKDWQAYLKKSRDTPAAGGEWTNDMNWKKNKKTNKSMAKPMLGDHQWTNELSVVWVKGKLFSQLLMPATCFLGRFFSKLLLLWAASPAPVSDCFSEPPLLSATSSLSYLFSAGNLPLKSPREHLSHLRLVHFGF